MTGRLAIACVALVACSVEKLPPLRMAHRGELPPPRRVAVLPVECTAHELKPGDDPKAWCQGVHAMITSELAFRGAEIIDLESLPIGERRREVVAITLERDGETRRDSRRVEVTGPMYSEADAWLQRAAIEQLGVDTLVRARVARTATWPVRTLAVVRLTRPSDAALIKASVCELETSRIDTYQETAEKAIRCALDTLQ